MITYTLEPNLSAEDFRDILIASTLAERRPTQDLARLDKMLRNADIIVTARTAEAEGKLIGIARAVSDFAYCCYLSDLAVDVAYQKQGIGKKLIAETHRVAGYSTTLLLVAAPAADSYYPKIGMRVYPCFGIPRAS